MQKQSHSLIIAFIVMLFFSSKLFAGSFFDLEYLFFLGNHPLSNNNNVIDGILVDEHGHPIGEIIDGLLITNTLIIDMQSFRNQNNKKNDNQEDCKQDSNMLNLNSNSMDTIYSDENNKAYGNDNQEKKKENDMGLAIALQGLLKAVGNPNERLKIHPALALGYLHKIFGDGGVAVESVSDIILQLMHLFSEYIIECKDKDLKKELGSKFIYTFSLYVYSDMSLVKVFEQEVLKLENIVDQEVMEVAFDIIKYR